MSPIAIAAIVMLVLLFLNVPVFASVTGACVVYALANPASGISAMLAVQREISGMQSVTMLAIPFFVATGALMNYCGITERMLRFCKVLTGHMFGGLGQVNIVLSTLMGGMSGSSLADAAMEAKLLVPDMRKSGYPNGFASAITAANDAWRDCRTRLRFGWKDWRRIRGVNRIRRSSWLRGICWVYTLYLCTSSCLSGLFS